MYCLCCDLYTSSGKVPEEVLKSLEDIKNSKSLNNLTLKLGRLPSHYMVSIVCGCFLSRTLEELMIEADAEVRICDKCCLIVHFLVYSTVV